MKVFTMDLKEVYTAVTKESALERLITFKEKWNTNIIEGLNRQFRKVTKTKSAFPNDDSLRKILYLASNNIVKKNGFNVTRTGE